MGLFSGQYKAPQEQTQESAVQEPEQQEVFPEPSRLQSSTVIAVGITVSGDVHGSGTVQVEGTVEGRVKVAGTVTVTETGRIIGPVEAEAVYVAGRVEGNISATDHLRLERSGMIEGDVTSVSFVIEEGGCLNGRSTMMRVRPESRDTLAEEHSVWP